MLFDLEFKNYLCSSGRGGFERKTPPPGYVCYRCKVAGMLFLSCLWSYIGSVGDLSLLVFNFYSTMNAA